MTGRLQFHAPISSSRFLGVAKGDRFCRVWGLLVSSVVHSTKIGLEVGYIVPRPVLTAVLAGIWVPIRRHAPGCRISTASPACHNCCAQDLLNVMVIKINQRRTKTYPIETQTAVVYRGASRFRTIKLPAMPPAPLNIVHVAAVNTRFHCLK